MKLGSLFDDSGGFPLADALSGITSIWASEIEMYPITVTRSRFPDMEHLGNVIDIRGDKYCVQCSRTGCNGRIYTTWVTEYAAAVAWNRRANEKDNAEEANDRT